MGETKEGQGIDGNLDLSVDFADLVLSESDLSVPKFQTQFDAGIKMNQDETHNHGAQDIHSQLLVASEGGLLTQEVDQTSEVVKEEEKGEELLLTTILTSSKLF